MIKHATIILMAIVLLASCATLQPQTTVEPDAAVAEKQEVKLVESAMYFMVPRDATKVPARKGTILDESGTVRYDPIGKIRFSSPGGVLFIPAIPENVPVEGAEER